MFEVFGYLGKVDSFFAGYIIVLRCVYLWGGGSISSIFFTISFISPQSRMKLYFRTSLLLVSVLFSLTAAVEFENLIGSPQRYIT